MILFSGSCRAHCAGVAQLAEQLICNQPVGGSSPFASSTKIATPPGLRGFSLRAAGIQNDDRCARRAPAREGWRGRLDGGVKEPTVDTGLVLVMVARPVDAGRARSHALDSLVPRTLPRL